VEVTWSMSGGHMSRGDRGKCDSGRGTDAWECEWKIDVGRSTGDIGRRSGGYLRGGGMR
jgi:hypothetical protein